MAKTPAKMTGRLNAKPKLVVTPETSVYYANFVLVAHSQYDFSLSFARINPPFSDEILETLKKGEPFPIEATIQMIIPAAVAEGLITALTVQHQAFKELATKKENPIEHQTSGKRRKSDRIK